MKTIRALFLGLSLSIAAPALADRAPASPPSSSPAKPAEPGAAKPTEPSAAKPAEPSAAKATNAETKKEGGCAVGQEGGASWLLILGLGLALRSRRKTQ